MKFRNLVLIGLLLLFNKTIWGQGMDNYKYHAAYVPSNLVNKISIDGDLSDWKWIPEIYKIRMDNLINTDKIGTKDLKVEFFVAWSDISNKIYVVAKVEDDIQNSDFLNHDDGMDIIVNANKLTGEYWAGNNYKLLFFNMFAFSINPIFSMENLYIYYGPRWVINKKYFNYYTITKNKTTYYEVEFNLWEYLSLYSSKLSNPLKLRSDLQIGLTIAFNDVDNNIYQRDSRPRTISGDTYMQRAEESSCFILDPPGILTSLYEDLVLINKQ